VTTPFDRELTGFRFVDTNRGDNLIAIAARELGDGTRWAEVAWINGLRWPGLVDDPGMVRSGVVLSGTQIKVPAATATVSADADPAAVFLVDIALVAGRLAPTAAGDVQTIAGLANLRQALERRIKIDRGELVMHPLYGSDLRRMIGAGNGPALALVIGEYAKAAVARDDRIAKVPKVTVTTVGDANVITVLAETILGRPIQLTGTV